MAYCTTNFKTKKALKEAVASGEKPRAFQPGSGPDLSNFSGSVSLEGPHFPEPHKWYARVEMKDGIITKVS